MLWWWGYMWVVDPFSESIVCWVVLVAWGQVVGGNFDAMHFLLDGDAHAGPVPSLTWSSIDGNLLSISTCPRP